MLKTTEEVIHGENNNMLICSTCMVLAPQSYKNCQIIVLNKDLSAIAMEPELGPESSDNLSGGSNLALNSLNKQEK